MRVMTLSRPGVGQRCVGKIAATRSFRGSRRSGIISAIGVFAYAAIGEREPAGEEQHATAAPVGEIANHVPAVRC